MKIFLLVISGIFVNNYIFSRFLGLCPFLGVSKQLGTAAGMGIAVTFVMTMTSAITYMVQYCILVPLHLEYLQTIAFILVIAALVQLVEIILKKYLPGLYKALGIYLPLITTNCAVLGVVLLNIDNGYGFAASLINSFGGGVGFMIAMIMFAGVRERMEDCDIPERLQGLPITLVAAALTSCSFLGFSGLIDNIFK